MARMTCSTVVDFGLQGLQHRDGTKQWKRFTTFSES